MFNAIRKLFSPPVFDDKEKSRSAGILNTILWASFFLLVILRAASVSGNSNWMQRLLSPISILIVMLALLIFVMKLGYIWQTSFILLITAWAALSFQAYTYSGIYDVAYVGTVILILLAGLLLDFRFSILFAILSIITGWGLAYYQTINGISIELDKPFSFARDYSVVFTLLTLITYLIISGLRNALIVARDNEQKQVKTNLELLELQASLEKRVEARTQELQETSAQLEKRAKDLEVVSDISRVIASNQDIDKLLPQIVNSIGERYGFYHTGIYLLNESRDYVVLSAASGENSQLMLKNQHKMRVDSSSLVGLGASRGQSRVVPDVLQDATYQAIPELPATKSKAVLPLQAGPQLIGVLDIESTQPNAFSEREMNIFNTLANQVAISIQNARSFSETRQALAETEKTYQQFIQQGWGQIVKGKPALGYKYSQDGLIPLTIESKVEQDSPVTKISTDDQNDPLAILAIPIKLRGQTIGTMRVQSTKPSRKWDQDELAMVQATAERAALALENARLLEDSQRRATKERIISDIAARITGSISMDNILKTAAEQLGQAIPSAEVVIQFQNSELEQ